VGVEVAAKGEVDGLGAFFGMAVDDGEVGFLDGAGFPGAAEGAGGGVLFGD
jgi:hypothetical protein